MRRFSFATIITAKDSFPVATHLPFLVTLQGDSIVLTSHFARANDHWKQLEANKVMVIFSEPHAYISPSHYDKILNVPTWNYISVHAYGNGTIITEKQRVIEILENTVDHYEASYRQQWNNFPDEYKSRLSEGIVAFEVVVTDLQAKKKLSQNKTEAEQAKIIASLSKSNDTNERMIADYMKANAK